MVVVVAVAVAVAVAAAAAAAAAAAVAAVAAVVSCFFVLFALPPSFFAAATNDDAAAAATTTNHTNKPTLVQRSRRHRQARHRRRARHRPALPSLHPRARGQAAGERHERAADPRHVLRPAVRGLVQRQRRHGRGRRRRVPVRWEGGAVWVLFFSREGAVRERKAEWQTERRRESKRAKGDLIRGRLAAPSSASELLLFVFGSSRAKVIYLFSLFPRHHAALMV